MGNLEIITSPWFSISISLVYFVLEGSDLYLSMQDFWPCGEGRVQLKNTIFFSSTSPNSPVM